MTSHSFHETGAYAAVDDMTQKAIFKAYNLERMFFFNKLMTKNKNDTIVCVAES